MEYRKWDKLGVDISLLGFGCMRFPLTAEGKIDRPKSKEMIDFAYRAGVNYYDTAWVYHNGESENFVCEALAEYPRSSYYIATKLPVWEINTPEDVERIFTEQLRRLNRDHIDFYLLHSLYGKQWDKVKEMGIIEICERFRKEGRIKYLGFSFHDEYPLFDEIIRYYPWDFCQIQLNYIDTQLQAGIKGYQTATELGIPVIVMEPIKGGTLASFPPDVEALYKASSPKASMASWAFRWVGSLQNVKLILSGMSTLEQVEDNCGTCNPFAPLSQKEQEVVAQVVTKLESRVYNGCTGCNYCMPCPQGVNIPFNFQIWNQYGAYQNKAVSKGRWSWEIPQKAKAENCISCGICEDACPQQISIRADLAKLQAELDAL